MKNLKKRFFEIRKTFENGEYEEQLIYDLEEDMHQAYDLAHKDKEFYELDGLGKQIKDFKKEFDFYDAEAELDTMFPDRHDDDFDEDQMSWDSVFGD